MKGASSSAWHAAVDEAFARKYVWTRSDVVELREVAEGLAQCVQWFVDARYGVADESVRPPSGEFLRRARRLGLRTAPPRGEASG